jgi:invasion protein IalB
MSKLENIAKLCVAGLLAAALGVAEAGPAKPAAKKDDAKPSPSASNNQQFDDWGYRCDKPEGAAVESCNIIQIASQNAQGQGQAQWLLQTAVGYIDGQPKPAMIVKARLGTILPPGAVVTVPGHNPVRIPFQRCDQTGCIAYVLLDDPFLKAMKDGDAAAQKDPNARGTVALTFQATDAQGQVGQQAVALPLSLKGFTRAFAVLKPPAAAATAATPTAAETAKDAGKKKK